MRRGLVLLVILSQGVFPAAASSGAISGTLRGPGGAPLEGACVRAEDASTYEVVAASKADAMGAYELDGLPPSQYRIEFEGCESGSFLAEWFDDQSEQWLADLIEVDGGVVRGIDATLEPAGTIAGRVDDGDGGPLAGICVSARGEDHGGSTTTNDAGVYRITGLRTDSYVVAFEECEGEPRRYLDQWFSGKTDESEADHVALTTGQTVESIDATLQLGGSISGVLTGEDGAPAACHLEAWNVEGEGNDKSVSDPATGKYQLRGLTTGRYRIEVFGCDRNLMGEWYDDTQDPDQADLVDVIAGSDTPGIDAVLAVGGKISGHLIDQNGDGAAGYCVDATHVGADGDRDWFTETGADGAYSFEGLSPGLFKLRFADCLGDSPASIWFHDKQDFESADAVRVSKNEVTSGIDQSIFVCSTRDDGDSDGLDDCSEHYEWRTDPRDPDTDGDLFSDGFEVEGGACAGQRFPGGSDPNDATSTPAIVLPGAGPASIPHPLPPVCDVQGDQVDLLTAGSFREGHAAFQNEDGSLIVELQAVDENQHSVSGLVPRHREALYDYVQIAVIRDGEVHNVGGPVEVWFDPLLRSGYASGLFEGDDGPIALDVRFTASTAGPRPEGEVGYRWESCPEAMVSNLVLQDATASARVETPWGALDAGGRALLQENLWVTAGPGGRCGIK